MLAACTLGNRSGTAADEALDVASTLRALLDSSVAHFLALLEMARTLFAKVFVSGHGNLTFILDNPRKLVHAPR